MAELHIMILVLNWYTEYRITNGLFQKEAKYGGQGHTSLKEHPEFLGLLPLEIPDKTKLHPWTLQKIVLHLLEMLMPETKTSGNFTWFFLVLDYPFLFVFLSSRIAQSKN